MTAEELAASVPIDEQGKPNFAVLDGYMKSCVNQEERAKLMVAGIKLFGWHLRAFTDAERDQYHAEHPGVRAMGSTAAGAVVCDTAEIVLGKGFMDRLAVEVAYKL